jgi:hypothetical protein
MKMHQSLNPKKRQRLRDYIRQVGTEKKSELLKLLPEIDGDMQLLTSTLLAAYFDGKSAGEQIALLKFSFGIHPLDIRDAFEALAGCSAAHLIGADGPFTIIAEFSPQPTLNGSN